MNSSHFIVEASFKQRQIHGYSDWLLSMISHFDTNLFEVDFGPPRATMLLVDTTALYRPGSLFTVCRSGSPLATRGCFLDEVSKIGDSILHRGAQARCGLLAYRSFHGCRSLFHKRR